MFVLWLIKRLEQKNSPHLTEIRGWKKQTKKSLLVNRQVIWFCKKENIYWLCMSKSLEKIKTYQKKKNWNKLVSAIFTKNRTTCPTTGPGSGVQNSQIGIKNKQTKKNLFLKIICSSKREKYRNKCIVSFLNNELCGFVKLKRVFVLNNFLLL